MENNEWSIIFEDLAKIDLQEIYNWYEAEQFGLGDLFFDEVEKTVEKIKRNALFASKLDEETRGARLRRFPYHIIYLTEAKNLVVYVIAITHLHREQDWYKSRYK